jgi:hypothetical protein
LPHHDAHLLGVDERPRAADRLDGYLKGEG